MALHLSAAVAVCAELIIMPLKMLWAILGEHDHSLFAGRNSAANKF
jgi:hypothetical protein